MFLWNLLTETSSGLDSSGGGASTQGNQWVTWVMWGVVAVVFIVMMVLNRRNQKKRQEETQKTLDSIQPGNTVKTIGGICGTVVEVFDDNTFVLETGSEKSGKSYLKFDKQAVYQTDAVAKKEEPKTEEVKEEKTEE